MTARYIVGDSLTVLRAMPDASVDLVLSSPPFLALRSYLPSDHPDKQFEIGSEATPAEFIDVLLELTAEWRRVLAPHGSIAVELGDTYSGSGGAGGDYAKDGLREGQPRFKQLGPITVSSAHLADETRALPKSLMCVPEAYRFALAYGINPHTGQPSPAGRWRLRNVVRWCRPNPPVGALGDKWRPATSDIAIACMSDKRYWDGDATRVPYTDLTLKVHGKTLKGQDGGLNGPKSTKTRGLDRQALTHEGAPLLDYWVIVPKGYEGAHYAVYPPELCVAPIEAMCPRRVCTTCGAPSRRETEQTNAVPAVDGWYEQNPTERRGNYSETNRWKQATGDTSSQATTTGWSTCGCPGTDELRLDGYHTGTGWRPGIVLDPFAGTGTTLAVATGHGRDAIGIDLDPRNADLALQRVGPLLLTVEHFEREGVA